MSTIKRGTVSNIDFNSQTSYRNKIINADFSINQRGFTSTTTDGTYGLDRWLLRSLGDGTTTYSVQQHTLGSPVASGYESTQYARLVTANQTASTVASILEQRIESVRDLSSHHVTVSFWAKSASGTPSVSVSILQNFGSGGSPSSEVDTSLGKVTISDSWKRYWVSGMIPSISGKTLGTTANTHYTALRIWTSAGSNYNSSTNTLGIQTNTFDFWGVQLEQTQNQYRDSVFVNTGSQGPIFPTRFEERPVQIEVALCQRYFEKTYDLSVAPGTNTGNGTVYHSGSTNGSNLLMVPIRFKVEKRGTPVVTAYYRGGNSGGWNYERSGASGTVATTIDEISTSGCRLYANIGATWVSGLLYGHWAANAEL